MLLSPRSSLLLIEFRLAAHAIIDCIKARIQGDRYRRNWFELFSLREAAPGDSNFHTMGKLDWREALMSVRDVEQNSDESNQSQRLEVFRGKIFT